jgi:D-alanine transaminase
MPRIAYVNGRYVPHAEAAVHIEDRGYQFADGVYEVIAINAGRLIDETGHLDRLGRSLGELSIAWPMPRRPLQFVMREVIRRNGIVNGMIYLQVTRGVARRDHPFPQGVAPSLVMTARRAKPAPTTPVTKGVGVITFPDIRWARCDIKSISLLPNVLGKQAARQAGAFEGWMVDGKGLVTEGTSTNAWIVTNQDQLVTRDVGQAILNGITRLAVIRLAAESGLDLVERPFSVAEAKAAREAFVTSTTSLVQPVVTIDGEPVGDGKPGRVALLLRRAYEAAMTEGGVNG